MRELGYRPNAIARSLQGQRFRQTVGLIFPGCKPFYGEMVYRLESYLAEGATGSFSAIATIIPSKKSATWRCSSPIR